MHLTTPEVERFYKIWFPLLYYLNQQRHLLPSFPHEWGKASVSPDDAVVLRDALWEDDGLREAFMAENPANLAAADLALVDSWKHRVVGDFFIFRYLKKYTVMLSSESPTRAYGVVGLASSFEEMIGPQLPIYVNTTLLPFEDRIIYDGLLGGYPVFFGGGIRSDLNDAYRDIQEREGVITTLMPVAKEVSQKQVQTSNKKVLTAFQKHLGASALSPKMIEEHTRTIAEFGDSFLLMQNPPTMLLDINPQHIEAYRKLKPTKAVSFKRFVWFLRDTYRIDWDDAQNLLDFLKRKD